MSQIMLVGTNFSSKHAVDMIWNSFFCFYEWYLELIPTQTNQKNTKISNFDYLKDNLQANRLCIGFDSLFKYLIAVFLWISCARNAKN